MAELLQNVSSGEPQKEPWSGGIRGGLKLPRAWIDDMSPGMRFSLLVSVTALASVVLVAWWGQTFDITPFFFYDHEAPPPLLEQRPSVGNPQSCQERGTCLLHAWSDDELFKLAMVVEKETRSLPILNSSENSSGVSRTVQQPSTQNCTSGNIVGEELSRGCGLKIAFLFLARGALPLGPLWNKYFEGHEGLYNIYVHVDPMNLDAISRSEGVFWGRVVPSQRAERGSPGLIAAARRLMANALLEDPRNQWFAIVSDSCIPVHGFQYAYKMLSATEKSFIGWADQDRHMKSRWLGRGEEVMLPEIPLSDFRISSQFFTLRRFDAVLVVNDTLYWSKFRHPCLPKLQWNCFPEEHYFATLLSKLDRTGTTMNSPTLIDWSNTMICPRPPGGGHPREFCAEEINEDFILELQTRDGGQYLFSRKFHPNTLPKLLNISNTILQH